MPPNPSAVASPPSGFAPTPAIGPARWSERAGEAAATLLRAGGLLLFVVVVVVFTIKVPSFLAPANVGLILAQSAVLGILGFGLTLVLITGGSDVIAGGIDLSLAGTLGLSAAVFAALNQAGYADPACVGAALGTGLVVGGVNALSVVALRILPLLATLAVMNICAGLELVVTENTTIPAASPLIDWLGLTGPLDVPVLGWLLLALALGLAIVMRLTPLGLRAYAVGGHPEAARAAGIATGRYVAASYLASGLLGGLAGSCRWLSSTAPRAVRPTCCCPSWRPPSWASCSPAALCRRSRARCSRPCSSARSPTASSSCTSRPTG